MERDLRFGITQHLIRCREVGATRSPKLLLTMVMEDKYVKKRALRDSNRGSKS